MKSTMFAKLSFLALTSVLTFSSVVFAGNGDGYSGPTLSGDAIQVNFDRAISEKSLHKAAAICNKSFSVKESLVATILSQVERYSFENLEPSSEDKYRNLGYFAINQESKTLNLVFGLGVERRWSLLTGTLIMNPTHVQLIYSAKDIGSMHDAHLNLVSKSKNIPTFSYSSTFLENTYDELTGDLLSQERFIKGLKVKYDFSGPAVIPLYNSTTERKTAFSVPLSEITQCVVNELSKI